MDHYTGHMHLFGDMALPNKVGQAATQVIESTGVAMAERTTVVSPSDRLFSCQSKSVRFSVAAVCPTSLS